MMKKRLLKQNIQQQQKQQYQNLQEAPESIRKKGGEEGMNLKQQADSIGYTPIQKQAPTYVFKNALEGLGTVTDITEHDKIIKEHEQRKIQRMQTQLQN